MPTGLLGSNTPGSHEIQYAFPPHQPKHRGQEGFMVIVTTFLEGIQGSDPEDVYLSGASRCEGNPLGSQGPLELFPILVGANSIMELRLIQENPPE